MCRTIMRNFLIYAYYKQMIFIKTLSKQLSIFVEFFLWNIWKNSFRPYKNYFLTTIWRAQFYQILNNRDSIYIGIESIYGNIWTNYSYLMLINFIICLIKVIFLRRAVNVKRYESNYKNNTDCNIFFWFT